MAVDTPLKLRISFSSSRTHIRNVWSVFLQRDLSQRMKVCFGNQVFSRELSKIMFSLMKIHRTFFIVISIPRVKSKSKNTPDLRHTVCVSAHAWGETVTKLVWRARQCFPNQRLLQALSLPLGRSWSLGGEGMREWSSSCESILQANLINIVFFWPVLPVGNHLKKPNCLLSNQKPQTCPVDHKDPLLGLVFQV